MEIVTLCINNCNIFHAKNLSYYVNRFNLLMGNTIFLPNIVTWGMWQLDHGVKF